MSDCSRPHGLQPTRLLRLWDFPGKSTGVGCHCLLHSTPQILLEFGKYYSSLVAQIVKVSAYNAGDPGSIPGSERSPEEGNGTPLQYSCLENPMDGGAWWAAVHGVAQSRTQVT